MHPTSIMPSNELTLCTAAGITLLYCVKCQHHYGPVRVCVSMRVCERECDRDTGQYPCYQSPEGKVQREQEQDREEIEERISRMEATGSHWGR